MTLVDVIPVALVGVLVGAAIPFLTYLFNRNLVPLTPSAKLWDRAYELDKLVMQQPELSPSS